MDIQTHTLKEMAKHIIDRNPNFPDWVKKELKAIVDANETPQAIFEQSLAFLSTTSRW